MKEALYYKKYEDKKVRCQLCPRKCVIAPGKRGDCSVRENQDGMLVSLVYGKPCAVAVDPIEKKPFFHFLPGSTSLSIGTAGCELHCLWCQNWATSQAKPEDVVSYNLEPKEIVKMALQKGCKSISYTYNEPTVFFEFALETAKLARQKGLKNTTVTNGFINKEPARELYEYIDAANIDLKGFTEDVYRKYCLAELKPVLEAIKTIKEKGTWIEITNLVIPTLNDKITEVKELCLWVKNNLGEETPLHFSRFYPQYKLNNIMPTPEKTLLELKKMAETIGLKYVYVGNTNLPGVENTVCPNCKKVLIKRNVFDLTENNIKEGKCKFCSKKIAGVFS